MLFCCTLKMVQMVNFVRLFFSLQLKKNIHTDLPESWTCCLLSLFCLSYPVSTHIILFPTIPHSTQPACPQPSTLHTLSSPMSRREGLSTRAPGLPSPQHRLITPHVAHQNRHHANLEEVQPSTRPCGWEGLRCRIWHTPHNVLART